MRKIVLLICVMMAHSLYAQENKLVIDNQTPGWLSGLLTYPQQQSVEDLTLTGYVNKADMAFVNGLIKKQKLRILDLSDVRLVGASEGDDYIWDNFLSYGTDVVLQKVRLPKIVKSDMYSSTKWISSKVDTLEIGYKDMTPYGGHGYSIFSYYAPNHLIIAEGVEIIPDNTFLFYATGYSNLDSETCLVTLPQTLKVVGGRAFGRDCTFEMPLTLPDSIVRMGSNFPITDSGHFNEWWVRNPQKWESYTYMDIPISSLKFEFPSNLEYYNSLCGYAQYQLCKTYACHVFTSDTIIVGSKCDTLYACLNAKIAYFYNETPVQYYDFRNFCIDTLYVPEGSLSEYLNEYNYQEALRAESGQQIKAIKEMKLVKDIEMISNVKKLYVGDRKKITTRIIPTDATFQGIYWESSNPEIAEVSNDGTIHAKAYGSVIITATTQDGGYKASCTINVYEHTTGIEMAEQISIPISSTYMLDAKTIPLSISDGNITYHSDNSAIASVDTIGTVTAIKKGICTVTATTVDGGFSAVCRVRVTQPVEALTMEKHSTTLKVDESEKLFGQIYPATADDKTISWSSTNEEIVTVDADGNATAIKVGEAWVKAVSLDNSEAKDSCKVTVIQPVAGIILSQESCHLTNIGETVQLEATVLPADASNKEVKWSSSNKAVCMVSNGMVEATGSGTAVVIATTEDGNQMAFCSVTVEEATEEYSFTIKQIESGSVSTKVKKGSPFTVTFNVEEGWKIHSVSLNNEDCTDQISADYTLTIEKVMSDCLLNVVYEQSLSAMKSVRSSDVKIFGTAIGARVTDVPEGTAILVYSEDGVLLKSLMANGSQTDIPLTAGGIYIIKVEEKIVKLKH